MTGNDDELADSLETLYRQFHTVFAWRPGKGEMMLIAPEIQAGQRAGLRLSAYYTMKNGRSGGIEPPPVDRNWQQQRVVWKRQP